MEKLIKIGPQNWMLTGWEEWTLAAEGWDFRLTKHQRTHEWHLYRKEHKPNQGWVEITPRADQKRASFGRTLRIAKINACAHLTTGVKFGQPGWREDS